VRLTTTLAGGIGAGLTARRLARPADVDCGYKNLQETPMNINNIVSVVFTESL
jgi:hypothetical protein